MRSFAIALAVALGLAGASGCHGCDDEPTPAAAPDAGAVVDMNATNDASRFLRNPRLHQGPVPHTIFLPCRAIAVDGEAHLVDDTGDAGLPLAVNTALGGAPWMDLAAGARLTVKDPRTSRETVLLGAAHARACVDRGEDVWLARGTLEASPGAGDSPGAEQWVATSVGVVRVSASRARVEADAARASITVMNGGVSVWAPADARATFAGPSDAGSVPAAPADDGWIRVTTDAPLAIATSAAPLAHARAAAVACEAAAAESQGYSAQIADGGAIGDLAPKDVRARVIWRAACAFAQVAVAALPPKDRAPLALRVSSAAPFRQPR